MVAAQIQGVGLLRRRGFHHPYKSVHHVLDPAEGAHLFAAAVDRDVAVLQRRHDHLHHHALVHDVGPASVCVEDACDACVHAQLLLIGPVQGFRRALAFAQNVLPRISRRWIGRRIAVSRAVYAARRGEQYRRMLHARGVEGVYRALHVDPERLDGQRLVVAHARRRSEVVNLVAADSECIDDVVVDVPEQRMLQYAAQQRRIHGVADIDTKHFVALFQKAQTEVCADKSHSAQYDNSLLHLLLLFAGVQSKIYSTKSARGS